MRTLLVAGGAGFIGSNFVRWMLAKYPDLKIVNVDKLTYAGNLDNVADLPVERHIFVQADIADAPRMAQIIEEWRPDAIVNFAAETHVDRSIHEGLRDFVFANVMGPQVLAEATKKFNIPLYIQISTDEVFGALGLDEDRLFHEETPFAPNMPYAACKAGGDLICRSYFQTFKTPIIVTHCSNNYGPYQYPEKFIPQAISKALRDEPTPIYGDGLYVRDWIHVNDHGSAIDLLLARGVPGEVYNIGVDNERSNIEIVQMLLRMLGKPEDLTVTVQDRPGHDRRYAIDARKITALGWVPEFPREKFEDGLRAKIQWYADNAEWVEKLKQRGAEINAHIKI
ncbi:MAG: dTDP-glucose 4,6-dehydratase [Candidatus Magasanikbacteria bacterium RIFCSPHIGHO2_02_FULL_50_9b]|uniref:dTDP-glucose 4,6-dehydratase n=1 Tax=Candidatus Magasanikbacteria bacterium RIFCSPHIGHO2_02_FULL_50_9b TaxID=1798682 RepID=A0A1F6M7M3_9BACT|nr:MAG: dTDP-glucose 4,6-dehydratase [Candidatus Magasanikbacteria bacterium RIFCSPHIGHO2_02_FULL_50_9b]